MNKEFLEGAKEKFMKFFDSLKIEDNVGIFSHKNCIDGTTSALFMSEALKSKGIVSKVIFMAYSFDMMKIIRNHVLENKFDKVIILDIAIDKAYQNDFNQLEREVPLIFIDHHLPSLGLKNSQNIIPANDRDCTSWVVFSLVKHFINPDWNWLLCPTMISEFSYLDSNNLQFLQSLDSTITKDNINSTKNGEMMMKLGSLINYCREDPIKAYEILKKKDLNKIEEIHKIVSKEFDKYFKEYVDNKEYYPESNLYFYYFNPAYGLSSAIITTLSMREKDKIWVCAIDTDETYVKVSMRNNGGLYDLNALAKKTLEGFPNSTGGGHKEAVGLNLMKKDLPEFKKRLIANAKLLVSHHL